MSLIQLRNIQKTYHLSDFDVPVLKGISLDIQQGEYISLMGSSGSGKSTLMNILGCLDRPTDGEYLFEGEEVSYLSADARSNIRNQKIGFVFQNFNLLRRTTALENVMLPLVYSRKHYSIKERKEIAMQMLEFVGIANRADHHPSQLSGGQQQRVAIARALISRPPIILADEPTGNLDSKTGADVLEMFKRLNQEEKITIVVVTHDAEIAQQMDRVVHIHDGLIIQGAFKHGEHL